MRWEDERYVRVYTRDTVDWLSLGWEAQALFVLLLRKVDRAGIIDLGKGGAARGLASLLRMPEDVVGRALEALLEDGCVEQVGHSLVVRNFIEAQEAPSSDVQRKREQRARDRDKARALDKSVPKTQQSVTKRDEKSRAVTDGHSTSQSVTPNRAVPSRAVPSCAVHTRTGKESVPESEGEGALRVEADEEAGEFLERIAGIYREELGQEMPELSRADEAAVRELVRLSRNDNRLIFANWRRALQRRKYPECRTLRELARHWGYYGPEKGAGPPRPGEEPHREARELDAREVFG